MAFFNPKKAKNWFKHIHKNGTGLELEFDIYYFCLMAGLYKPRKASSIPNTEIVEVIRFFPNEYKPNRHFIIALFLSKELMNLGVSLSEKKILNVQLNKLIDPLSPTSLSDIGMKELNKYAFGGFQVLQEYFPEPPRNLDAFLIGFYKMINSD